MTVSASLAVAAFAHRSRMRSSSRRLGITNITTVTRACGWTFLLFRTAERVQKVVRQDMAKLLGNTSLWWFPPTMPPQRLQTMSASHRKHTLTHV